VENGERTVVDVNPWHLGFHGRHVRPMGVRRAGESEDQRGAREQHRDSAAKRDSDDGHGPRV
jgi:hypothetical protein